MPWRLRGRWPRVSAAISFCTLLGNSRQMPSSIVTSVRSEGLRCASRSHGSSSEVARTSQVMLCFQLGVTSSEAESTLMASLKERVETRGTYILFPEFFPLPESA